MPYTPEQIQERYDKLPADIKQSIDSVDTTNTIVDIGEKHDLMYDQISELVDEVGLVMVGLTPSPMFPGNISKRMKVDIGKAMLISKDINKAVFDKMRDSLKKIEGGDEAGFNEEQTDTEQKKPMPGLGEETMMTDAEKATQGSVISAVEKAGGFVIDKPVAAPAKARAGADVTTKDGLESKKDIINILEKESFDPSEKIVPVIDPDHMLGDTPEVAQSAQPVAPPAERPATQKKQPDQSSIVDMLLSKGVAMPMDSTSSKTPEDKPSLQKAENKNRPYDGIDPYREPIK